MKLLFFHVSHTHLIEKFLPRDGVYRYNFYWVENRYHDYTSLEHPEKHIHFFIRDPWVEGYDFTFMQGIGKSENKLRDYYHKFSTEDRKMMYRGMGGAPILRIADPLKPDLIASYDKKKRVYKIAGSDQSFKVLDDENNLIPFIESEALRAALPDFTDAYPVGARAAAGDLAPWSNRKEQKFTMK